MDYEDYGFDDFNEYDSPEMDDAEQFEINCLDEDARLDAQDDGDYFEDDGGRFEDDFDDRDDSSGWEAEQYYEPDFF